PIQSALTNAIKACVLRISQLKRELRQGITDDRCKRDVALRRRRLRDERSDVRERRLTRQPVAPQVPNVQAELRAELLHRITLSVLEVRKRCHYPATRGLGG